MFGYVIVNKPELKIRELDRYKAWYCGLCHSLRSRYGIKGQLTLSYDMTFLAMFLSALYEPEETTGKKHCVVHPFTAHPYCQTVYSDYAADVNLLLAVLKCRDDWQDEHKLTRLAESALLKNAYERITQKYPDKCSKITELMKNIADCEARSESNIDLVSGLFGHVFEEIFVYTQDAWETELRRFGFYLGKFIYLMDAWEDRDKDEKDHTYNPFLCSHTEAELLTRQVYDLLVLLMSECSRSFERLPILQDAGILRNIIYSGVWSRYEALQRKEDSKQKDKG